MGQPVKMEDTNARFETTQWSLIGRLRGGTEEDRRAARDEIARVYWPAVYARLRHTGFGREKAAEVTQAFFADVVLMRHLLEGADAERGKLRTLLLTALKRFQIDQHRRAAATSRAEISLEDLEREEAAIGAAGGADPDREFDLRWARAALFRALRRCEEHYRAAGKVRNWEAYERWKYHPSLNGCKPPSREALAAELGFRDGPDLSQAVQTVDKKLRAILHEVISETTSDDEEAEREYAYLASLMV